MPPCKTGLFLAVCGLVGTSLPNAFVLWAFSVLAIFAVGVSAGAVMAVFGNPGLLINLVFFVILGLPSSGGTVPLEASPKLFTWIAAVEPMHLIYYGVRSILYFDADPASGLMRSVVMCVVGLVIGAVLGIVGTKYYDAKGWFRRPNALVVPPRLAKLVDAEADSAVDVVRVPAATNWPDRRRGPRVTKPNVVRHR